ncbi:g1076 [Coccomyxa elongata]
MLLGGAAALFITGINPIVMPSSFSRTAAARCCCFNMLQQNQPDSLLVQEAARFDITASWHQIPLHQVIAKRGEHKVHHFAHASGQSCDPWRSGDGMGPWHRWWLAFAATEFLEVTITRDVRHIADIRVPDTGLVIEVQHSPLPVPEARARELFYDNMIWILDATHEHTAVCFHGRNFAIIATPRLFWSDLTKPVYIDTLSGLFQPVFWIGRQCLATPVDPLTFFASKFGKALASSAIDTAHTYSKAHSSSHKPLTIDLETRVISGNSYPYRHHLAAAGFSWCPPSWMFITKAEKRAKEEEEFEEEQLALEALRLSPEYQERQRQILVEQELQAQRRRDEQKRERLEKLAKLDRQRKAAKQFRLERDRILQQRQDNALTCHSQLMSDAEHAIQRLLANPHCSEASRKAYLRILPAATAGTLSKQKAESLLFLAQSL